MYVKRLIITLFAAKLLRKVQIIEQKNMLYNIFLPKNYNPFVFRHLSYFCFITFAFETFRKECLQEKHIHAFESGSMDVEELLKTTIRVN